MKATVKRIIILSLGWIFIILGAAGLFLPGLQGILFLLIGLGFLSREYPWARKLLKKLRTKYPALGRQMDKVKAKEQELLHRITGKIKKTPYK